MATASKGIPSFAACPAERVSSGEGASCSGSGLCHNAAAFSRQHVQERVFRTAAKRSSAHPAGFSAGNSKSVNISRTMLGKALVDLKEASRSSRSHRDWSKSGSKGGIRAGYFGEYVDDDKKQQRIQAQRRFQVRGSDHIDGESPLQEVVVGVKNLCNQRLVVPVKLTLEQWGRWWNSTLPGRLGSTYCERRRLSVRLYGRLPVFVLFLIFQASIFGADVLLRYLRVGGLFRPLAMVAISFVTGPPFIQAFLPGIMDKEVLEPPDPNEDVMFDEDAVSS